MNGDYHLCIDKIKILALGDSACGKTSLLRNFAGHRYSEDYESTVFDFYPTSISLTKEKSLEISLWDTSGSTEFDTFRPLAYPGTSVILLCYDIGRPHTLESIKTKWLREAEELLPDLPKALVGCKRDLRIDWEARRNLASVNMFPVSINTALNFAKSIGVVEYFECSCKKEEETIKIMLRTISMYAIQAKKDCYSQQGHSVSCIAKGSTCHCRLF